MVRGMISIPINRERRVVPGIYNPFLQEASMFRDTQGAAYSSQSDALLFLMLIVVIDVGDVARVEMVSPSFSGNLYRLKNTSFSYNIFIHFSQVRFNTKTRSVEMKTSKHTIDTGALQKGADFVSAFCLGFEVQDAVALLRLDDLYLESFQVTDVKTLRGDHLSRAIGRIAGQDGKTRFAIENATRTRIVIADQRIHLLGSYANLRVARNAICDLILGAPPGKVYNSMRNVSKRMSERY
jgi:RNA-binding protein PNO1